MPQPPAHVTLEKAVGETPLQCLHAYRAQHAALADLPMCYAVRLDPMASGKLLILIGDTCKVQHRFHALDKAYTFSLLLGVASDTHDVLGRLSTDPAPPLVSSASLRAILQQCSGRISLPYPHFSAKTVGGKPLHTWTLEGRLDEIEIPVQTSTIYALQLTAAQTIARTTAAKLACQKINTLPPVTDSRKALGQDFRRVAVLDDWQQLAADDTLPARYQLFTFQCIASSGTYMRSLASEIAQRLNTVGLAWHIHRAAIGRYDATTAQWITQY